MRKEDGPNRVLLIDNDVELAELLSEALAAEGYEVEQAWDGQRGLQLGLTRSYDVLIIDRMLPAIDGLDLLTRLRAEEIPARALMLTALGTVEDRVIGLNAGADDYMVKPFDLDELSARVRALCRRTPYATDVLRIGSGHLDLALRDAVLPGGARVALSDREFELLRALAASPFAVHSREELRGRVFDVAAAVSIVDTYVHHLRRKLGRRAVRTIHGQGYRLGEL